MAEHVAALQFKSAPVCPGVYKMFDAKDRLLYVGKAKRLQVRLAHYIKPADQLSIKTAALMRRVVRLAWVEVACESDALVLENELIKAHKPPYNIALRDDKSYYYLVEDTEHAFPSLRCERRIKQWQKGHHYYGPYPNAKAVKQWLNQLQKWFLIRQCNDMDFKMRKRPCVQYQLKRCSAPCVGKITEEAYGKQFNVVRAALGGASESVLARCQKNMQEAANVRAFEAAAFWRDLIAHMQSLNEQGRRDTDQHCDVFAIIHTGDMSIYAVGWVRFGRMQDIQAYQAPNPLDLSESMALAALIPQFYMHHESYLGAPNMILTNQPLGDTSALLSWLKKHHKHAVSIKGQRCSADEKMWLQQVQQHVSNQLTYQDYHPSEHLLTANELSIALKINQPPTHVECWDVSHSAGHHTYASCVVFNQHGPNRRAYRCYRIAHASASDDYGALKEALEKHYMKCALGKKMWPALVVIDGGKGQLGVATSLWDANQWPNVALLSISKGPARLVGEEHLHVPNHSSFKLPRHHKALRWLQHLRDEAHRFALKFHRKAQAKTVRRSVLEQIPGIGPKKRQALLIAFGGIAGLKRAPLSALEKVPGIHQTMAKRIFDALQDL